MNTGNVIVRWTYDQFLHQAPSVLAATHEINMNTVDRHSIPVFFGSNADANIEVVPT